MRLNGLKKLNSGKNLLMLYRKNVFERNGGGGGVRRSAYRKIIKIDN